jgi:predicted membrane protein
MTMRAGSTPVTPQLVFGLFVMGLGVILGLDSLGIADAGYIVRFWPVGLMMLGGTIATRPEPHGRFWGFFWIFVGAWLLLRNLNVLQVGFWQLFWPMVLVWIGGNLILKTMRQAGHLKVDNTRAERLFAVMSECKRRFDGKPFEGAYMTGFMGGCVLDLRRAVVPPGETKVIEVFGMMVGHEIKAPQDWAITMDVMPIMGEVKDKRVASVAPPPLGVAAAPTLLVRGSVVMGSVHITD